jgi:methylase of polypeptide subunit release factors
MVHFSWSPNLDEVAIIAEGLERQSIFGQKYQFEKARMSPKAWSGAIFVVKSYALMCMTCWTLIRFNYSINCNSFQELFFAIISAVLVLLSGHRTRGLPTKGNGNGQYSDTYLPESELNAVVARITNPVLGSDYAAYAKLDSLRRDSIFKLLVDNNRTVSYGPVHYFVDRERFPTVWPPNIDTLSVCRALSRLHEASPISGFAVELGCGNGFISQWLLRSCPMLRKVLLVDVQNCCVECAQSWITDPRAAFAVGRGEDFLSTFANARERPCLVVCNPPYVPTVEALLAKKEAKDSETIAMAPIEASDGALPLLRFLVYLFIIRLLLLLLLSLLEVVFLYIGYVASYASNCRPSSRPEAGWC